MPVPCYRPLCCLLALLAVFQLRSQKLSLIAGPSLGLRSGTLPPAYVDDLELHSGSKATGLGWLMGAVYDTGPDSLLHERFRVAWHRDFWSQTFTSSGLYYDPIYGYGTETIAYAGTVDTRIDEFTGTALLVVPLPQRFRVLLGLEMGVVLSAHVHDRTTCTRDHPAEGPNPQGGWTLVAETDTTHNGAAYLNRVQVAFVPGLEWSALPHFRIAGEMGVGVVHLANSPPLVARLVLGYVF